VECSPSASTLSTGIGLADVQHVAVNQDSRANFLAGNWSSHNQCSGQRPNDREVPGTGANGRKFPSYSVRRFPARAFPAHSTKSSIASPICPRPFTSRRSVRRWSSWSTASATLPARRGERVGAARSASLDTLLDAPDIDQSAYDALILDVQGAELLVLRGALRTLQRMRYVRAEPQTSSHTAEGQRLNRFLSSDSAISGNALTGLSLAARGRVLGVGAGAQSAVPQ
jgi:hypothetical protein